MKKRIVYESALKLTFALLLIMGNLSIISAQTSIDEKPLLSAEKSCRFLQTSSFWWSIPTSYIAKSTPWRFGIGGGLFFSTLGDWHRREGRREAEYSFITLPGLNLFVQYHLLIDQRGKGGEAELRGSKPGYLGYLGFRLEYTSISSSGVNTSDRWSYKQRSESNLSGHIVTLSVCEEAGQPHGGYLGFGLALASLRAEKTDMTKEPFITTVKKATGFGFTFGFGYSLIIKRNLFWRVIGIDYCFIFNCDLELPDFGSNLGMAVIGTKVTVML